MDIQKISSKVKVQCKNVVGFILSQSPSGKPVISLVLYTTKIFEEDS